VWRVVNGAVMGAVASRNRRDYSKGPPSCDGGPEDLHGDAVISQTSR
jgi:hypothetical protein